MAFLKTFIKVLPILIVIAAIFVPNCYAVTIENNYLLLEFNGSGELSKIFNKQSGQDYYHGKGKKILKVMHLQDKAILEVPLQFQSGAGTPFAGGNSLVLKYLGEGIAATVSINVYNNNPKTAWELEIENSGDKEVVEVIFPDFDNIYIGNNPADDYLVRPNRYGQKIPNPAENLFQDAGKIVDGMVYNPGWNLERLEYTGSAGMFWMDLYDATGGLYLASEDKTFIGGYLGNTEAGNIGMYLGKYLHVKKSQKFTLPYAVGVHTGDWHQGADMYREWAQSFMKNPKVPRWAREMPTWNWRSMIWSLSPTRPKLKANFYFNDIDGILFDGALGLKSDNIGLAGQEFMGHDYPFWWPDPTLGDIAVIKDKTAKLKRRGGHCVPYINPIYAWENFPQTNNSNDPEFQERYSKAPPDSEAKQPYWDFYKKYFAKKYDGNCSYVEANYFGPYPQMCMACTEWQDYTLWWTKKYEEYGFSGVQWDRLGAYPAQYCCNWEHGHQHGGASPAGTIELSRRIFEDPVYKVSPEFFIWYEGSNDCFHQYLHLGLAGMDCWMAYSFPEMIAYTFQSNCYSTDPAPISKVSGEAQIRIHRAAEYNLIRRQKLVTMNPNAWHKKIKITQLINAIKGIYWYTKFKDDVGCIKPAAAFWAKVLEISPQECPYVGKNGYIIPYVDMREAKKACQIKLSKNVYDLSDVKTVYWYPCHLQGLREEIAFDNSKPDYLSIDMPDNDVLNIFNYDEAFCKEDGTISNVGAIVIAKQQLHPLKILAPQGVKALQKFNILVCEQKIVKDDARVSIELGKAKKEKGLKLVAVDGVASPQATNIGAKDCYKTAGYVYLDADDKKIGGSECIAEVRIEYYDLGRDTFRIQYNSSDSYAMPDKFGQVDQFHKSGPIVYKQDSGSWKVATLVLPDAMFANKMSGGSDLCIDPMQGDEYIASITVVRKKVKSIPVPHAVVEVGNDKRQTDKNGIVEYVFSGTDPSGAYILDAYKDGPDGFLPTSCVLKLE